MTDDTEALLVANACMLHALIARLIEKDILSPEEVGATMVDAEAYLAGLPPALMTPVARDRARRILQQSEKIFMPGS